MVSSKLLEPCSRRHESHWKSAHSGLYSFIFFESHKAIPKRNYYGAYGCFSMSVLWCQHLTFIFGEGLTHRLLSSSFVGFNFFESHKAIHKRNCYGAYGWLVAISCQYVPSFMSTSKHESSRSVINVLSLRASVCGYLYLYRSLPPSRSGSRSRSRSLYLSLSLSLPISRSLALSVSSSRFVYVYMYIYIHTHIYILYMQKPRGTGR